MPGVAGPVAHVSPGAESQRAGIVQAAAKKWNIPAWVLWGVYGTESTFGSNVHTSSQGAVGSFQFEPSTAATYGYPLTNATDLPTFAKQADSAAHYLADLYAGTKSWDVAISHYNSGPHGAYQPQYVANVHANGIGINTVKLSSSTWVGIAAALGIALPIGAAALGPEAIIGALGGGGAAADAAATDSASVGKSASSSAGGLATAGLKDLAGIAATGGLTALLLDPRFLWRLVKIIGGAALIIMGLLQLASAGGARIPVKVVV